MRFFGLLDSKRVTGAYEFTVFPGDVTRLEVKARIYVRERVNAGQSHPIRD